MQMTFSNENIKKLHDKKSTTSVAQPIMPIQSPSMSKAPTADSMGRASASSANLDIEGQMGPGHWFFGIQIQSHPYSLLLGIVDCLQVMGFVMNFVWTKTLNRNGDSIHQSTR